MSSHFAADVWHTAPFKSLCADKIGKLRLSFRCWARSVQHKRTIYMLHHVRFGITDKSANMNFVSRLYIYISVNVLKNAPPRSRSTSSVGCGGGWMCGGDDSKVFSRRPRFTSSHTKTSYVYMQRHRTRARAHTHTLSQGQQWKQKRFIATPPRYVGAVREGWSRPTF